MKQQQYLKPLIIWEWGRWAQAHSINPRRPSARDSFKFFLELQAARSPLLDFQPRGRDKWQIVHGWLQAGCRNRCINVLIADRYPVVVQGLRKVLGAQHNFKIVACCSDGTSCIEAIRSLRPDIAILDISMPGLTGLEILSIVNSEGFCTRVVFTASVEDRELVMSAAAGAYGVILKDATLEILVKSLQQVADGQRLLPLPSSDQVSREQSAVTEHVLTVLTDREHQIMRLVSEGLSNKEIGRRLNISDGTIKVHLHHIYQKLEISNRTVLAALAISQNEITGPPAENQVPRILADWGNDDNSK